MSGPVCFWLCEKTFIQSLVKMRLLLALLMALSCPSVLPEVVKTFQKCSEFFANGQPPVIPNILKPNEDDVRYKKICQNNGVTKGSGYTFATLYDTSNRIPVFSASKYTGSGNFERPNGPWRIEPQLDPPVPEMTVPYRNQAIDEDYFTNTFPVNRGHLFPSGFAPDQFTAISTFTLTNIVPQNARFNAGGWNRIERETRGAMDQNCRHGKNGPIFLAHVLTGAVPGNNKLNDRVNIPSHMWMAFCCKNGKQWVSQAYWALNKDDNNENINKISLGDLEKILSKNWVKNVKLFKETCTKKNTHPSSKSSDGKNQ